MAAAKKDVKGDPPKPANPSGSSPQTIMDIARMVRDGSLDPVEFIERVIKEVESIDKDYHYMNELCKEQALAQAKDIQRRVKDNTAKGRLLGVPVSVKDCICVKGVQSRAGSAILNGYNPVFDATVIANLKKEGAIIIGKTAQDEFGFGGFSINVGKGFKVPKNPIDPQRSTGGSSGGAAGLTKKLSFPHLAVSESTGGSIENPASFCGVVGLCPTYGLVSRYGLIDYANSLDKIGPIAKTVEESAFALDIMRSFDSKDSTSVDKKLDLTPRKEGVRGMRIGVLTDSFNKDVEPQVQKALTQALDLLKSKGAEIEQIALPKTAEFGVAAYYILAMAEASTNLAKLSGMRYGSTTPLDVPFNEYFARTRSMFFGEEVKRRIMLGTFARMAGFRDAYYIRAATVRKAIIDEFKAMFRKVDVIVSPAMPIRAPKIDDISKLTPAQHYMMDILTVGPNLAGLPHASVPIKAADDLPIGFMTVADHFNEKDIITVCKEVEAR